MPLGLGINGVSISDRQTNGESSSHNGIVEKCIKCPETAVTKINNKDTYCESCFLHLISHKFRGTLGRQRVFSEKTTRVLIAFDGGPSSTSLLSLVQSGLSAHVQRKLLVVPVIVTILTSTELNELDEFFNGSHSLFDFLKSLNIESYVLHLGTLFLANAALPQPSSVPSSIDQIHGYTPDTVSRLNTIFASGSETSQSDLKLRLKTLLLYQVAETLNLEKIMTADTATSLSKRVLNHIALGRGAQISADAALVDKRHPRITVVRPMRDFSEKEIALHNHFKSLQPPVLMHSLTLNGINDATYSIQGVTDGFVSGLLAAGFPATVNTVMSSAGKVQGIVDSNKNNASTKCQLCFSDLSTDEETYCYGCKSTLVDNVGSDFSLLPDFLPRL